MVKKIIFNLTMFIALSGCSLNKNENDKFRNN